MNYPDWAPRSLVELHRAKQQYIQSKVVFSSKIPGSFNPLDPESIIEGIVQEHEGRLSVEGVEKLRQRLYRNSFVGLPANESTEILGRLVTDQSMKSVWSSITKHAGDELGPVNFFSACENAIAGWRGEQKNTKTERNKEMQRVQDLAAELSNLLHECQDFDFFSIANMIDDEHLQAIADGIASHEVEFPGYKLRIAPDKSDLLYFRTSMNEAIPSVHKVLEEVVERAKKISARDVMVKKPGSAKAGVHYFVRFLSDYCRTQFSKPLHDVVAVTAATVFQDVDIDSAYVVGLLRKGSHQE
jgi:hypothetical protein